MQIEAKRCASLGFTKARHQTSCVIEQCKAKQRKTSAVTATLWAIFEDVVTDLTVVVHNIAIAFVGTFFRRVGGSGMFVLSSFFNLVSLFFLCHHTRRGLVNIPGSFGYFSSYRVALFFALTPQPFGLEQERGL